MSNYVTIEPTKFEDVRSGHVSYGVRVYDNYGATYTNMWESIPDNDMDVLSKVVEELSDNDIVSYMIDYINEEQCGIMIGDCYYEYAEISDIISR